MREEEKRMRQSLPSDDSGLYLAVLYFYKLAKKKNSVTNKISKELDKRTKQEFITPVSGFLHDKLSMSELSSNLRYLLE